MTIALAAPYDLIKIVDFYNRHIFLAIPDFPFSHRKEAV